jgi:subtilisin family serine protease
LADFSQSQGGAGTEKSIPAVKADAARSLFKVKCDEIRWAVLDTGIDATHSAFQDDGNKSRILKAFDFSNIRKIVSLDNLNTDTPGFNQRVEELRAGLSKPLDKNEVADILKKLAEDADNDRPILWGLAEKLIDIDPERPPRSGHGTHVAGIIGARRVATPGEAGTGYSEGMCPDIKLYDFRVLAKSLDDTEFAIIAALQYIRYLNERNNFITLHGANLSLSIPHDVRTFACGELPSATNASACVKAAL